MNTEERHLPLEDILKSKPIYSGNSIHFAVDKHRILRFSSARVLRENIPDTQLEDAALLEQLTTYAEGEFSLLESYGIHIPEHTYGISSYDHQMGVFCVTERVVGQSLFASELKDIPFSQLRILFEALVGYILRKHQDQAPLAIWNDISIKQFMYGHVVDQAVDLIYLTDLDPIIFIAPAPRYIDDAIHRLGNLLNIFRDQLIPSQIQELEAIYVKLPKTGSGYDPSSRHPFQWRNFT
ncbi:hypothetical protein KDA08_06040 [Candidatus Saccharibacteria bacterium]|nr:hypothetical protein [Candidatus Saccharibacteria bacterium]